MCMEHGTTELFKVYSVLFRRCERRTVDNRTASLRGAVRVLVASPGCESGGSLQDMRWTTYCTSVMPLQYEGDCVKV